MNHVFPVHVKARLPLLNRGESCYLIDNPGNHFIDESGGAAVSCHGDESGAITKIVKAQLDNIAFAHTGFYSSAPIEQSAQPLIAHTPTSLDKVYIVSDDPETI